MNAWIKYQPKRERDKILYDIKLRNGSILERQYPNGNYWNDIFGLYPKLAKKAIADYRVIQFRISEKQLEEL